MKRRIANVRRLIKRYGTMTRGRDHPTFKIPLVKNARFSGDGISLEFNGEKLENQVKVVPHEVWVESWDRHKPIVYIDDDAPKEYREYLAIHGTIEKRNDEKGMDPYGEGHVLAELAERQWFLRKHTMKEWDAYNVLAELIFRKELKALGKEPAKVFRQKVLK